MIHILHSLAKMDRGGAETFIMNVLRKTDHNKYKISFLLNSDEGDYIDEIKEWGCDIYTIAPRSQGVLKYLINSFNFFSTHKNDFDAIHCHRSSLSSIEYLWFAKFFGIKKRIIHSHSSNQNGRIHKILHNINKLFLRFAATDYIACSNVSKTWMYRNTGKFSKAIILKNGIDSNKFIFNERRRLTLRRELNIPFSSKVIIHVGRFIDVKNHEFLVEIFNSFHRINNDSFLIMIGKGENYEFIKNKVNKLNLSSFVLMPGVQKNIYDWLQAADIFIMPSFYEGLPICLVEAQASGLPLLVSDTVSKDVQITSNVKFLSLKKDVIEWTKAINEIFEQNKGRNSEQDIINAGFDIKNTNEILYNEIYIN